MIRPSTIRPHQWLQPLRKPRNLNKSYSTLSALDVSDKRCAEVSIPVPWGHVAGKLWGNPDVQPILALHGVQDNAATFDRLAPLLDAEAVLALDLPGHGRSSHLPVGLPYHFMDAVTFVRFIVHHHYKWSRPVVLIGHSFGSLLSLLYASIYPDRVSKFVSIDCSRHHMCNLPDTTIDLTRQTIEKTLKLEKKTPPEYSYEELLEKFYVTRKKLLLKESCEILLSRGLTKLDNGKMFLSRDPRLNLDSFGRLNVDELLTLVGNVKCDVLSIQAVKGTVKDNVKGNIYRKTIEIIQGNSGNSEHVVMHGNHHLHLDDPKPVAAAVNRFLSSQHLK